jgi:hypothetical protein
MTVLHTALPAARSLLERGSVRPCVAVIAGLLAPCAAALVLVGLRPYVPSVDGALALVAVLVAVAWFGQRGPGLVATVSALVCFDLFLTPPYGRWQIASREDIETAVLIAAVGVAVTELGHAVRHSRAELGRCVADLEMVHAAAEVVSSGGSPTGLADGVAEMLRSTLRLRDCGFRFGPGGRLPVLDHDGIVRWGETEWDVRTNGLPLTVATELYVYIGGRVCGRFVLTGAAGAHPTIEQRLSAVALADQVGAAMAEYYPAEIFDDEP